MAAIFLALNKILNLGFLVNYTLLDNAYLYLLSALLVGTVFLFLPAHANARTDAVPWYDALLYLLSVGVFCYFSFNAYRILSEAWEFMAPTTAVWVAGLGWLLLLEATRRAGGTSRSLRRWSRRSGRKPTSVPPSSISDPSTNKGELTVLR